MSLFQKSVLNKYLKAQDQDKIKAAYQKFTDYFHNPARQENIRNAKEEQFQEGFLRELFVKVLGYTLNPEPDYNLTTEFKNEKGAKKADGAILKEGKAIAVIELKGTDTKDLDKVNDQAFGYKNNQSNCVYVVTSNFEKLRFFIHNAVEHIEFNLFNLSYDDFAILWLCLHLDNVLADIPLKTKEGSIQVEENITKQLYKDYSTFKRELWQNICKNSPDIDQLLLFKKSQKLLDRFLFIFFAEDSGLLPPNTIDENIKKWDKDDWGDYDSLYDVYKRYFGFINKGRPAKGKAEEIFAYNGGLFLPDEILDNLSIDNDLLAKHTAKLSAYDFQSEVDVNILGHIFENSLNEIENVTAQLQGLEVDKSKTKRKKDGVFYTPKYITKYIVDNTVGALCTAKKAELGVIDEKYAKNRKGRWESTLIKLDTALKQYRDWLLNITICDPACGSGAFLNQALEFLINEHAYIDELNAQLFGSSIIFQDVSNHVLENNIFGVDINEESVEIAKLSLWLRTAQKGRKLTSLNNNIKCGNSLIDDPAIAGEKAFNWQKEFSTVFENGGFDVVVGNPPYGDYFSSKEKDWLKYIYIDSFSGTFDMYIFFFEISIKIIKSKGKLCFITPNTFVDYAQFSGLRKVLKQNNNVEQVIGLTKVFEDAIVDNSIILLTKNTSQNKHFKGQVFKEKLHSLDDVFIQQLSSKNLFEDGFILGKSSKFDVLGLIQKCPKKLKDLVKITQGITTGGNNCFINSQDYYLQNGLSKEIVKRVIKGKTINRYKIIYDNDYILYSTKNTSEIEQKKIEQLLVEFKEKLSKKRETKRGKLPWYCLHWSRDEKDFKEPKILIRQTASHVIGVLDTSNYYPIDTIHTINLKEEVSNKREKLSFILAVLNSKLFEYLYKWKLNEEGKVYPQVKKVNIEWLPFVEYKCINNFSDKVKNLHTLISDQEGIRTKFLRYVESQFNFSAKNIVIQYWHNYTFSRFIIELNKVVKKTGGKILSKIDEMEWMEVFDTKKAEAQALQAEINQADKEIDAMVYELYGLTDEEIKIVEAGV